MRMRDETLQLCEAT